MKLSWKIFISTLLIVLFSLSAGGALIITLSFQNNLDNELVRMRKENRMMGMETASLMQSKASSPDDDENALLKEVLQVLGDSWSSSGKEFQILSTDNQVVGGNIPEALTFERSLSDKKYTYVIKKVKGKYYAQGATVVNTFHGHIKIISNLDITHVFQNRRDQIDTFCKVMFGIGGFSAILNAALAVWLTRPIFLLTRASKSLSRGDMKARVKTHSEDEIGLLSVHFNEMADALEEKINELEDAARRQEDFVGSFTHELKTPLTSIIGYADLLRSRDMDENTRFEASNYIYHEGKRLESLSLRLLEFLVEGNQEPEFRTLPLTILMEEVLNSIHPELLKKNIKLINNVSEHKILANQDLIKIVIFNILDNARKAVSGEGTIELSSGIIQGKVYVMVKDNGRGIPQKDLGKITEAFYMVDKSRSRNEGGAGLGLSICARIMQLHKGEILFESEVDKGTTVTLLFGIQV